MEDIAWDDEYERLLQKLNPDEHIDLAIKTKRKEPRFETGRIHVNLRNVYEFDTIDISAQGIAIRSDVSFKIGARLNLTIGNIISIEVVVVDRNIFESDADFMEYNYRLGCKYIDPSQGKKLIVLMYQLDNLKLTFKARES